MLGVLPVCQFVSVAATVLFSPLILRSRRLTVQHDSGPVIVGWTVLAAGLLVIIITVLISHTVSGDSQPASQPAQNKILC